MHTLGVHRLRELYPRLDDFRSVRNRLDPHRVFASACRDQVLDPRSLTVVQHV